MRGIAWVLEAPCADNPAFVLPEGIQLPMRVPSEELLKICDSCPFRAACIARVRPAKSKFDGVCGGRLWCDGQAIEACASAHSDELDELDRRREPGTYDSCGREAGARAHRRRGERACESCLQAEREAARRRRAKAREAKPRNTKSRRRPVPVGADHPWRQS
ncbi:hypothetical protein Sipo8835_37255 [Streptomyces ipomoeae]|uniref:4Fe-4S Wbl-type domain-containing protein n=1 Tax=Streptomyces ipomoeae TaxID=103232 RepID=A0AAE8VVE5_9ACTN|nr:hypothetical protein [Streptomyces ipomoeae]TQE21602.1 hypothetical protein Sipo8835_37255 [Streptomyces ipomoeae]